MSKKTYIVCRAMQSGAESFERGDTREMTEADAAPLLALGALTEQGKEPVAREPAVRHTFGTAPVENPTDASSITVSDSRIDGRRSPAKRG